MGGHAERLEVVMAVVVVFPCSSLLLKLRFCYRVCCFRFINWLGTLGIGDYIAIIFICFNVVFASLLLCKIFCDIIFAYFLYGIKREKIS